METTILRHKTISATRTQVQAKTTSVSKLDEFWSNLEYNRFGLVPMLIVIVACVGGIAAAFAIQMSPIRLATVVLSTGLTEAFILGMLPMRTIVITAVISLMVSLLAILV